MASESISLNPFPQDEAPGNGTEFRTIVKGRDAYPVAADKGWALMRKKNERIKGIAKKPV